MVREPATTLSAGFELEDEAESKRPYPRRASPEKSGRCGIMGAENYTSCSNKISECGCINDLTRPKLKKICCSIAVPRELKSNFRLVFGILAKLQKQTTLRADEMSIETIIETIVVSILSVFSLRLICVA